MFQSNDEYKAGLKRLDALLGFPEGTPEAGEAKSLLIEVEAWEKPYVPPQPDSIEMIKYALEQRGQTSTSK